MQLLVDAAVRQFPTLNQCSNNIMFQNRQWQVLECVIQNALRTEVSHSHLGLVLVVEDAALCALELVAQSLGRRLSGLGPGHNGEKGEGCRK